MYPRANGPLIARHNIIADHIKPSGTLRSLLIPRVNLEANRPHIRAIILYYVQLLLLHYNFYIFKHNYLHIVYLMRIRVTFEPMQINGISNNYSKKLSTWLGFIESVAVVCWTNTYFPSAVTVSWGWFLVCLHFWQYMTRKRSALFTWFYLMCNITNARSTRESAAWKLLQKKYDVSSLHAHSGWFCEDVLFFLLLMATNTTNRRVRFFWLFFHSSIYNIVGDLSDQLTDYLASSVYFYCCSDSIQQKRYDLLRCKTQQTIL